MKRVLSLLSAVALLLMAVPVGVMPVAAATGNTTEFAGGSGTAEDPYLIATKHHLDNVRFYLSAHFKMINDIEFVEEDFAEGGDFYNNGVGWIPIGGYVSPTKFTGNFNGNGHKIVGLKIEANDWAVNKVYYLGLFADLAGVVHDLYFDKGSINLTKVYSGGGTYDFKCYVGALAGFASGADIKNVHASMNSINAIGGRVKGSVGGIVGCANNSSVNCCSNSSTISAQAPTNLGGIVGYTDDDNLTISMCYNTGDISNTNTSKDLGGILGEVSYHTYKGGSTTIIDCYNSGTITSGYRVGGISGFAYETTISNCYNVGILDARGVNSIAPGWTHSGSLFVSNSYYSIGNGDQTEGSTPLSDMQMQSNLSYSGFDFDTTWTMGGDPDYPYPELQAFALSGKLGIRGDVAYLSTVEPDLNQINRVDDTFTYEWLIDGVVVGTGDSYTLKAEDIGKVLCCKVTGTKEHNMGTLYSDGVVVSKAVQPDQPVVPELLMLDDNSFEITTNSNQEYSIDNVNWQSSGVFDNLDPNQGYTIYSRILENDLYLLGKSAPVLNVTTDRRPLYGTVSLVGTSRFGDTLTVDVSGVMPENATYTYEWKANGIVVGTGSTYKIAQDDIGKNITLSVKGNGDFIGTLTSASVTATKATVQLPNAPTIEETTNTTVKLIEKVNYEYSKDGAIWQDSPLFEGLSAATEYTFYQRVKETETTFASKSSSGTKVTTLKNNVAAPEKPVVEKVTNTTVTLKLLTGYEYSLDGLTWQKSNVFTGLSPNTEYSFCQRIAENKTDYASAQSGYTIVVTLKNTVAAPGAPKIEKATATSVTLVNTAGYEYSIDGKVWQTNNVFTGLTTLKTYTFYQRIKETNTDYTSATSAGTSFKVKYVADAPVAPTLTEKTNNKIVVQVKVGYEYSINKTTWTTTGVFTGLQPNQAYTVYGRIPETDTHYASAISNALTVTTLKNTVSAPAAPVLSSKNDVSVTLVANSAYEYSKDGTNWQKSNVFNGLTPNTSYTFYQRKAETNTAYASDKSVGLTVSTAKSTIAAPAAPTLVEKTATSVTLTSHSGYEYSKDGTTWQKSNVFNGLKPNTTYSFYQRVAETTNANASAASAALSVTTPKETAATPGSPTAIRVYPTSVVLALYTGYEYSMDGTQWQSSTTFSGLSANTSYTFYQRIAETTSTYASESSVALRIKTTPKNACSISPAKPIVTSVTSSSVALATREGYEYSKDGTNWQSSSTFTGLSANTSYTFYQRIKESAAELASNKSAGVSAKTDKAASGSTGVSTITNYQLLQNYIVRNGYTNSKGCKYIETERYSSGNTYTLKIIDTVDGLCFEMDAKSGNFTSSIGFTLSSTSKTFKVFHTLITSIEGAANTIVLDRTTITSNSWYTLSNGGVFQITASNATEVFNPQLQLLFTMFEALALDSGFTFGLKGLGFLSYSSYGDDVCDPVSGYHAGSTTTKNAYAATCTINGYTGDAYCSSCGEKKSNGSSIPSVGHHIYSDTCDATCNECGEERRVDHSYSNECDTSCNVCDVQREATVHCYDNDCDAHCNECNAERKPPHVYDNSDDLFCNGCGYERPPYTPGDLDGDDVVTDADAVHLLFYTFFPEDYALNQDCDFDGDGTVNDADAVYLLFYTFFPEDYPVV